MCAALANVEEDNWEWHTFDTIKGGDFLVDQDAAEIMCREAIDAIYDLEHMGMPFNRTPDGRIDQRRFGGHTHHHGQGPVRRACYAADRTGHMILQTLFQQSVKQGTTFFNEFYVLDLLLADGRAAGVVAYELATGELHVFRAKSVVLCTGGFGKVYKVTSNAHALTGDGPAVVYRRGLPLEDMEFFQFHPTGLYKLGILLSEAARGEGGILRNKDGVPIQPTAHYAMGGIPTGVHGEVLADAAGAVVPGLYAAGECACVSVHGANRLGTNSLLDIVVFGRRAGIAAAEHAAGIGFAALPDDPALDVRRTLEELAGHPQGERAAAIRADLQAAMDHNAGVYRTEGLLEDMEGQLDALRDRYHRVWVQDTSRSYNTDLLETVELGFLHPDAVV